MPDRFFTKILSKSSIAARFLFFDANTGAVGRGTAGAGRRGNLSAGAAASAATAALTGKRLAHAAVKIQCRHGNDEYHDKILHNISES